MDSLESSGLTMFGPGASTEVVRGALAFALKIKLLKNSHGLSNKSNGADSKAN